MNPPVWQLPLTIHVGHHKTGTTFLQNTVFADAERFYVPWSGPQLDDTIVNPGPFQFSADAARAELERLAVGQPDGRAVIVSHEDLVGHPLMGGSRAAEIGDRLLSVFPEARILVVVREQGAMLVSAYKQYIRRGGALTLRKFVDRLPNDRQAHRFRMDHYEYDGLVGFYQERLGADRVAVLPYEHLRRDRDAFVASIASFTGADGRVVAPAERVNVGVSAFMAGVKRPLNRLFVLDATNPAPLVSGPWLTRAIDSSTRRLDQRVPSSIRKRSNDRLRATAESLIEGRYGESNRRLAEMTGLDLAELGYQM